MNSTPNTTFSTIADPTAPDQWSPTRAQRRSVEDMLREIEDDDPSVVLMTLNFEYVSFGNHRYEVAVTRQGGKVMLETFEPDEDGKQRQVAHPEFKEGPFRPCVWRRNHHKEMTVAEKFGWVLDQPEDAVLNSDEILFISTLADEMPDLVARIKKAVAR